MISKCNLFTSINVVYMDRRGRDRMVVGFITYLCNQCLSALMLWVRIPQHDQHDVYSTQHYVIKFVSYLRHVGGFLRVIWFSFTNKTYLQDITEILLKVALNPNTNPKRCCHFRLVNVAPPCGNIYFDCSNKADRDYANLSTNCTTFAVCYGGKLSGYHTCPGGM